MIGFYTSALQLVYDFYWRRFNTCAELFDIMLYSVYFMCVEVGLAKNQNPFARDLKVSGFVRAHCYQNDFNKNIYYDF